MRRNALVKYILAAMLIGAAMLAFAGYFTQGKIGPGDVASIPADEPRGVDATATAKRLMITEIYEAVGTVRPTTETRLEAQVTGRVERIVPNEGDRVKRGDVVVVLDSRQVESQREQAEQRIDAARASLAQARQRVNEAQAGFERARATFERMRRLFRDDIIPPQEFDKAEADFLQARAALEQARQGVEQARAEVRRAERGREEAEIRMSYTRIAAPEDGVVVRRMADPGDLAFPGKPLLTIQTGDRFRLEASVREGLAGKTLPGQEFTARISALDREITGIVEEVVPSADPRTRSFLVKVGLPRVQGLYQGMFGTLRVPVGHVETVMVPERAVTRVGQLETVRVLDRTTSGKQRWRTIYVKTGDRRDGDVEILSGLEGGETVALPGSNHD